MRAKRAWRRGPSIPALVACFYAGGVAGWLLHAAFSPKSAPAPAEPAPVVHGAPSRSNTPAATIGEVEVIGANPIAELRRRRLRLPIDGTGVEAMKGGFAEPRGGGREHEAVDILAPRHTPVHAVDDGTIARLFFSKAGGTTIYQFDPTRRFCYYYAHLERYAGGLREGQPVAAGDVIGYVGTSGNAPPGTPHLHFAVFELTAAERWWEGRPLDPYLAFQK